MKLAPVRVDHAHADGVRRPVHLGDERDGSGGAPCVGMQFPNNVRRAVKELDAVLTPPHASKVWGS